MNTPSSLSPLISVRGGLHAKIGRDYAQVGDARGEHFLELALTELDPTTQTNELALATASLGRYHHYHAQHHRALEFLERARLLAEPIDDANVLTYLYLYLAGAYQHLMRMNESIAAAQSAIALGERKQYPIAIASGYEFLAEDAMACGEWRDALEYAQRDHDIGERIGAQDRIAWAHYIMAWTRHATGELAKAEAHSVEAAQLAETIADTRVELMNQALLTLIQSDQGAFEAGAGDR